MDSRQKVWSKQVFRAVIQAFYLANPRKPSSIEKEDDDWKSAILQIWYSD